MGRILISFLFAIITYTIEANIASRQYVLKDEEVKKRFGNSVLFIVAAVAAITQSVRTFFAADGIRTMKTFLEYKTYIYIALFCAVIIIFQLLFFLVSYLFCLYISELTEARLKREFQSHMP